MIHVHILLGGMTGGAIDLVPPTNTGMFGLRDMLEKFPDTTVKTWTWGLWRKAANELVRLPDRTRRVVIGYSGGGWKAAQLANNIHVPIDLIVAYDPSPARLVAEQPLPPNVLSAVCYHNTSPMMWWPVVGKLGGGRLVNGPMRKDAVITHEIALQHLAVQFDKTLHALTVKYVREMAG